MVVTSRCFAFRALIRQARIWKSLKLNKFALFTHSFIGLKLGKSLQRKCVNFFSLKLTFWARKDRILESIFLQSKNWLTGQDFATGKNFSFNQCHTKSFAFFLGKLFYKSKRKLFSCVCIAWYNHLRRWENSRRLCKISTSSRVCITVSHSPNPSRVYITLCKHGKRFLLLKWVLPWKGTIS